MKINIILEGYWIEFVVLEVDIECFDVLEVSSCDPEVVFGTVPSPAYEVFEVVATEFFVIEYSLHCVLGDVVDKYRAGFIEGA